MNTHADKTQESKRQTVVNAVSQKRRGRKPTLQFVDNRPEVIRQRKIKDKINNDPDNRGVLSVWTKANNDTSNQQVLPIQRKKNKPKFRGLTLSLHEFNSISPEELDRRLVMEMLKSGRKNIIIQNSTFTNPRTGNDNSFRERVLLHLDQLSRTENGLNFLKSLLATNKPIVIKQSTGARNTTSTTSTGEKERLAQNPLVADWLAKRGARILNNNNWNRIREGVAERKGGIHVQNYLAAEASGRDEQIAATDGRGTGSIVEIDPTTSHYDGGGHQWQTERPKFGLYHELIHALHKGYGTEVTGNHNNVENKEWQVLGAGPYNLEPFSEATIRLAMGKEQRPNYSGVTYQ